MKRALLTPWLAVLLGGCSGIIVQPLTKAEGEAFHNGGPTRQSGYVVYEPTVYFTISVDEKGLCVPGKTIVGPDYSRPYRIDSKTGLGKAGAEFTITDGWALGSFKDNSDNTAILGALLKAAGFAPNADKNGITCAGLYRLTKPDGIPVKVTGFGM